MGSKIYFVSDAHLGIDTTVSSLARERHLVCFLKEKANDAKAIHLVGDIFDYWFEYKAVIPRGFTRLLGTLAELTDNGVAVHFSKGNHDMWTKDYLLREVGLRIYNNEHIFVDSGRKFYLHHGDGLDDGDRRYKFIKKIFRSRWAYRIYSLLHPRIGISLMRRVSAWSRAHDQGSSDNANNAAILFCEQHSKVTPIDYYIMGHNHNPMMHRLSDGRSTYINLGDWMEHFTYAVWDGREMKLLVYEQKKERHTPQ